MTRGEPWSVSSKLLMFIYKMEWPCFRVCDTGRMTQRYSTHFELAFNFGERGTHITAGSRGHELDPQDLRDQGISLRSLFRELGKYVTFWTVRHFLGFQTACSRKLFTIFDFFCRKISHL